MPRYVVMWVDKKDDKYIEEWGGKDKKVKQSIDDEILDYILEINRFKGIHTVVSCVGHGEGKEWNVPYIGICFKDYRLESKYYKHFKKIKKVVVGEGMFYTFHTSLSNEQWGRLENINLRRGRFLLLARKGKVKSYICVMLNSHKCDYDPNHYFVFQETIDFLNKNVKKKHPLWFTRIDLWLTGLLPKKKRSWYKCFARS